MQSNTLRFVCRLISYKFLHERVCHGEERLNKERAAKRKATSFWYVCGWDLHLYTETCQGTANWTMWVRVPSSWLDVHLYTLFLTFVEHMSRQKYETYHTNKDYGTRYSTFFFVLHISYVNFYRSNFVSQIHVSWK